MTEEQVYKFPPLPGQPCPRCTFGRLADGMVAIGPGNEMRVRLGTKCPTCDGTGRVHVTYTPAYPETEK